MLGIGWGLTQLAATKAGGFQPETLQPAAYYNVAAPGACWQDPAGTVPALAAGDPVARLTDLSGQGRHLVQSVAQARPLLRAEGARRWLEFDGIDDVLLGGPVHGASRTIVMGFTPLVANNVCSYGGRGANSARSFIGVSGDKLAGAVGTTLHGSTLAVGSSALGIRSVALLRHDPSATLFRRNGGAGGSVLREGDATSAPGYSASMGALGTSGVVTYASTRVGIVIDVARALTDDECALAEAWVNERWGAY